MLPLVTQELGHAEHAVSCKELVPAYRRATSEAPEAAPEAPEAAPAAVAAAGALPAPEAARTRGTVRARLLALDELQAADLISAKECPALAGPTCTDAPRRALARGHW